jgi:hypothetical protein
MPNVTYGLSISGGDVSIQPAPVIRSADGLISHEVAVPAPKALSAWVKTDSDTAGGNLAGGHGYSTGKFDVYWTSGGGGRRYNVDGTISTNALALDGGSGDAFPASADTTVVVMPRVQVNTNIDGDALAIVAFMLSIIGAGTLPRGHILFADAGSAVVANLDLTNNQPSVHDIAGGVSNAFTGNPITKMHVSTSDPAGGTLKVVGVQDSTP